MRRWTARGAAEFLGQFHADAPRLEVVAVGVRREQFVGEVGDRLAHGDQLERQHVHLVALGGEFARPDEVGDVQETVTLLAWEREPESFGRIRFGLGEYDDVVAFRHRREVAVDDRGMREDALGCQSSAIIASRKALEPLAFVRSPIINTDASCANGVNAYSDATEGSRITVRSGRFRSATAAATARM